MKNLFFLLLLMAPATLLAQDVIYKTDGTRVEAKVQEVGIDEIKYKMFNNPDGPVYVIEKDDVTMIAYQNGTHELFNLKHAKGKADTDSLRKNKHKNIVSFNMFDLVFTNVSFSYERIFGDGLVGIKVPVSIGLRSLSGDVSSNGTFLTTRLWGTGIDVNFYPMKQGRVSYYLGPSFITGAYKYHHYYDWGWYPYPYPYPYPYEQTAYHFAFVINNGMMIQPTKNMNISMALGLGLKQDMTQRSDYFETKANLSVNFGYRF